MVFIAEITLAIELQCLKCDDGLHTFIVSGRHRPARGFDERPNIEWRSATCTHVKADFDDEALEAAIEAGVAEKEGPAITRQNLIRRGLL